MSEAKNLKIVDGETECVELTDHPDCNQRGFQSNIDEPINITCESARSEDHSLQYLPPLNIRISGV